MRKKKGAAIFSIRLPAVCLLFAACALLFTTCYLEGDIEALRPLLYSGSGTPADPFIVRNVEALQKVGTGRNGWDIDKYYKQTADIPLSRDDNWTPIGTDLDPFTGSYNGGGYKIDRLTINRSDADYQGLFGYTGEGSLITNVWVENVDVKGRNYVGGVVGYVLGGSVTNCYSTGSVSGNAPAGGVVGFIDNGSAANCFSTGDVSGTTASGVVGTIFGNGSSVTNCYSTGNVSAGISAGGVVDLIQGGGSVINCYSTGKISSTGGNAGGVIGRNINIGTVKHCVALGPNVTNNGDATIGRIAGSIISGTPLDTNYARSDMLVNVAAIPTDDTDYGVDLRHGANVDAGSHDGGTGGYHDQDFWQNTMLWDFNDTWEMGPSDLPILKGFPKETQNPEIKPIV